MCVCHPIPATPQTHDTLCATSWLSAAKVGCVRWHSQQSVGVYRSHVHTRCILLCFCCCFKDTCVWPQERHWKRAAACAVAHEAAAASRRSMLRHTAAIDAELQTCQDKVTAQLADQAGLPRSQPVIMARSCICILLPGCHPPAGKCTCFTSAC